MTTALNASLEQRCEELDKIISMFDKRVELDTGVRIKNKDIVSLKYYLNQVSANLLEYTKKEIELNAQKRENDIRKKQLSLLKNQYNNLKARTEQMSEQLETVKDPLLKPISRSLLKKNLTKNLGADKLSASKPKGNTQIASKFTMREGIQYTYSTLNR